MAVLALLAGCAVTGTAHPVPAAPITAAGFAAANAAGTEPRVNGGSPVVIQNPAPSVGLVVESMVWVPAGDHRVGTLALPAGPTGRPLPVVLLHGDLSSRNENGDLFTRLAADLAGRGIASLRIDFAGSGDSIQPGLALDYPGWSPTQPHR